MTQRALLSIPGMNTAEATHATSIQALRIVAALRTSGHLNQAAEEAVANITGLSLGQLAVILREIETTAGDVAARCAASPFLAAPLSPGVRNHQLMHAGFLHGVVAIKLSPLLEQPLTQASVAATKALVDASCLDGTRAHPVGVDADGNVLVHIQGEPPYARRAAG